MPSLKYVVELSEQDKTVLLDIASKGTSTARKILRANILLASDKQSDKYMTVLKMLEPNSNIFILLLRFRAYKTLKYFLYKKQFSNARKCPSQLFLI